MFVPTEQRSCQAHVGNNQPVLIYVCLRGMLFDLERQGWQGWQMVLVFLSEDFYKVFSTSCFPDGLCVLVPLAPVEQDHALSSALTNIPLSGIPETASVVVDGVAMS